VTTLASPPGEIAKASPPTYATAPGVRHFWIRRVHSLMGLLFGGYITVHLLVNATGFSPRTYQENVDHIHSLEPLLPFIEITAIFIPLLIHALYGVYITKAGVKFNTTKYNYGGNVRYTLQRWTAIILLLFIGYHVATLHKWGLGAFGVKGYPAFQPKNLAYQSTVDAIKQPYSLPALNYAVMAFYLLGIWSAVFHWANGLWTSAIAWGLTVTRASQKRWGDFCLAFGVFMLIVGTAAWVAFTVAGNPNVPLSETQTLSPGIAEVVHAQATGGMGTDSHLPANQLPDTQPGPR
jgi:succinate dehydrogenase / fumarate reductase cytochrome b subunit